MGTLLLMKMPTRMQEVYRMAETEGGEKTTVIGNYTPLTFLKTADNYGTMCVSAVINLFPTTLI